MGFKDKFKEMVQEAKEQAAKGPKKKITLELVAGYKTIKGKEVTLIQGDEPRKITFTTGIFCVPVQYEVIGIDWQESAKRSAGKAAAGAIIGGVLTGGIGLVAGAAIGGKRKDTSTAVITVLDNGVEGSFYVRCNGKQYEELTGLL